MSLGPGVQFHPPTLDYWNLLGTPAQVEQSAAGPNSTELGAPTYEAGVFGGAVRVDANAEAINAYNYNQIFTQNAGCVEMWMFNDGWTYTNGASSAGNRTFWSAFPTVPNNNWNILLQVGGLLWQVVRNGIVTGTWSGAALAGATAGNQEWHHWAFVWDTTGIDGGANTKRVYFDGGLVGTHNLATTMPVVASTWPYHIGLYDNTHNFFWGGRIDNVKHWNFAQTDFSGRNTEGYTPAPPTPTIRAPECAIRREPTITVGGIDITAHIRGVPNLLEERQLKTTAVFANDAKIKANNASELFSLGSVRSIFSGTNWQDQPVIVHDRWGVKVWEGLLATPQVDHPNRQTTIVSRSPLSRWKNAIVDYTSAGDETPAAAFENMCAAIGFTDIDLAALNHSKDLQAGMAFRLTLLPEDNVTFAQAISNLCIYGVADAYEHLGKIRYVAWEPPFVGVPAIIIDESDILDAPKDTRTTAKVINDYAIYESSGGGTTRTDAGEGNIGAASRALNGPMTRKDIASAANVQYDVRDQATAIIIGENWIRRTHSDDALTQPRIEVSVQVRSEFRSWVNLSTDFGLTYTREGWAAKRFRVIGFTRDDEARVITVRGLEW